MTDTFNEIKEELKIYYPAFTDDELTEMTNKLIRFFYLGAKAVYHAKQSEKQLTDIKSTWIFPTSVNFSRGYFFDLVALTTITFNSHVSQVSTLKNQ